MHTSRTGFDPNQWLNFYYKNPSPEKVPELIQSLVEKDVLCESGLAEVLLDPSLPAKNSPCLSTSCALTMIFRQHPEKIWEWIKAHKSLPNKPLRGLIEAVWLSNTNASREVLQRIQASTLKVAEFAECLLKKPLIDIESFVPINGNGFDFLWTAFSITGNTLYVGHLLDSVLKIGQNRAMPTKEREAIITSLLWSITSQVDQHPQLREFVRQHCQAVTLKTDRIIQLILSKIAPLQFTVTELFADSLTNAETKQKAAEVTKLVFESRHCADLKLARECAQRHFQQLSAGVNAPELDHLLFEIRQQGVSEAGLKRIAELYGYKMNLIPQNDRRIRLELSKLAYGVP